MQLQKLVLSVVLVSLLVKSATLSGHEAFTSSYRLRPLSTALLLVMSCLVEHAVFVSTIFYGLSESVRGIRNKENFDTNLRLYCAIAFPEIGKLFVVFLQVWDSEPSLLLIYGALMLSVQYTSLQCVLIHSHLRPFRVFVAAIVLRVICRSYFHSLYLTMVLGVIL